MEAAKTKVVFSLLTKLGWAEQKDQIVASFSSLGSASLKELTNFEGNKLIEHLSNEEKRANDPMRRKVIHIMCLMGYEVAATRQADYVRIDDFLQNRCGDHNPKKHRLRQLTHSELVGVLRVIEARAIKEGKYTRPSRPTKAK